jgi:hypothetical protein
MPMWVWVAIGVGSFLGLSILLAFGFARFLGMLGRQVSEMYETENWAALPPTRASKEAKERQPDEEKVSRIVRLR